MALTTDQVRHIAKLSRLKLREEEVEKFKSQLSVILDFIGQLNQVDTTGIPPSVNTTAITNRLRSDQVGDSLTQEQALRNSKQTSEGFFVVPNVFE